MFTVLGCQSVKQAEWTNDLYERIDTSPVDGGFRMENYWVWGSSVIRGDDGQYHMFVSRWPKHLTFHPGWMIASEIVHAVSPTPEGPYQFSDVALPARGAQYWDGRSTHNPKILKYKDTYILYYMGSTHPFADFKPEETLQLNSKYSIVGRSNKRIGIATSKTPYGPWQRNDAPVLDTKPDTFYSFLTSNPSPLIKDDGSVLMLFKSRAYRDEFPYHGDMDIGVATAPHYQGPYTVFSDRSIFDFEIEDPTIWRDDQGYHMLAKDQRGEFTGHQGAGIHAVSQDGLEWSLAEPALAYTKQVQWDDGTVEKMGQLERVSVLIEDGVVTHLFFATMDGPGGFENSTKSWNMVVPFKTK